MKISRRKFLKVIGTTGGSLLLGNTLYSAFAQPEYSFEKYGTNYAAVGASKVGKIKYAPLPKPGVRYAMAIETSLCIGCGICREECAKENNIGINSGMRYIKILTMKKGKIDLEDTQKTPEKTRNSAETWNLPVQCMQCDNPPCVSACPVQATWKEEDGITVVDYNKCIGCRYCMMNCPYWARHFNWKQPVVPEMNASKWAPPIRPKGVTEKCTFCIHRVREGRLPRCVEACPTKARIFGDINDPKSEVSKAVKSRNVFRLKEELGTEPRIFYLG